MMNKIIVWNCRGAGSPKTITHLIDMIQYHKPPIVALIKTRLPSTKADVILAKTYLTDCVAVEAQGFTGGIWLCWDKNNVKIEVTS